MKARKASVLLISALMGLLVVRVALVEWSLASDPSKAVGAWPGHPSAIMASGLSEVGRQAAAGEPIRRATVARIISASASAPLAPEPFLVRGVDSALHGQVELAQRSFLAARDRDPRSVPARYFLADHFLKTGQVGQGLAEVSALTRLVPGSLASIGPFLAAFARDPKGLAEVRKMVNRNPELEPVVLQALASEAGNAPLALSLWSGRPAANLQPWQQRLLESLIAAGQFKEARGLWQRFLGADAVGGIDRVGFKEAGRGPFSWTLASGSSGVVEADADGSARVIYFGRDDQLLASRLFVLAPGNAEIAMRVSGAWGGLQSLAWTVRCLPSGSELASLSLGSAAPEIRLPFTVPARDCGAQRIELAGNSTDIPMKTALTIESFNLIGENER